MEKIAIFGFGVIGSGVYELIEKAQLVKAKVTRVFDRIEKKDIIGATFSTDIEEITMSSEVDTVIECLGGVSLPYQIITKALSRGKNVITSNKEVVSLFLGEFTALAKENKVKFLFEASVGGGIPIIKNLCNLIKHDTINAIYGVLNGTSNYILTEMFNNNKKMQEAILSAQQLGYAEADPNADLEGLDMVRKIAILTMLVADKKVELTNIRHMGITNITEEFINVLKKEDKVCKLVASSKSCGDYNQIIIEPVVISKNNILSNINGAYNGIAIDCQYNGKLMFYGLGAGKYATASAIISDLTDLINDANYIDYHEDGLLRINNEELGTYYIIRDGKISLVKKATNADLASASFYAKII